MSKTTTCHKRMRLSPADLLKQMASDQHSHQPPLNSVPAPTTCSKLIDALSPAKQALQPGFALAQFRLQSTQPTTWSKWFCTLPPAKQIPERRTRLRAQHNSIFSALDEARSPSRSRKRQAAEAVCPSSLHRCFQGSSGAALRHVPEHCCYSRAIFRRV
jgi:hypothetical protein